MAAILGSILNPSAEKKKFFSIMGIPSNRDVVGAHESLQRAKSEGIKLEKNPFDWKRAFTHVPSLNEIQWLHNEVKNDWGHVPIVLDPMAGGGSIPYESMRLGLPTIAGDLNPVAYIILKATVEYPAKYGQRMLPAVEVLCNKIHESARKEIGEFFYHCYFLIFLVLIIEFY